MRLQRGRKYQRQLLRELSMILDLTAMAMEAGLDFLLALERSVAFAPPGPAREAFQTMLAEVSLGSRRIEALKNLQKRTGLAELNGLIQAVALSETLGANLAGTLKTHALSVREARFAAAEKSAQQIPVKLLFPLIFLIFPCVFLVLLGPILYRLLQFGMP